MDTKPRPSRKADRLLETNERLLLSAFRAQDSADQAFAAHALLDAVLHQMPCGVVITNPASERIILSNDRARKLWPDCLCVSDMAGYFAQNCLHSDGSRCTAEELPLARSIKTGEEVALEEVRFTRSNGSRWTMTLASAVVRNTEGRVIAAVLTSEDITEQRRLTEIEQAARYEIESVRAASRTKDEFLAMLSHELRTPLTPILGSVHFLRTAKLDQTNFERVLDMIERNAKAQARIIDDLLDVSRIISGNFSLNIAPVDLSELIESCIEIASSAAESKGIRIVSALERQIVVPGDGDRITQVIGNLLSNAVKFTPENGLISVRLASTPIHAEIYVKDTGIGIDPEFLPHVFERFRQADTSRTRSYGGLGLGLAIVRQLVELHRGTVDVESPGRNRGTTFVVRLPFRWRLEAEPGPSPR